MSFSLKKAVSSIASPFIAQYNALRPNRPDAPILPQAPTLTSAQLPQYPGFSPEEQQALNEQRGLATQISGYSQNPVLNQSYGDLNNRVAQAELERYYNSLQGNYTPSLQIQQQKAKDWEVTKRNAALRGIQLSGSSPESAVSNSTAGNQLIRDFNQRYGTLQQNEQFGILNQGQQANQQRIQSAQNLYNTQLGGYGQAFETLGLLQQPYQQQRLGQFNVKTQQAISDADIANQNSLNRYNAALGQTTANYNNALAGYQNNMGLLSSLLGLGGQLGSAYITRGARA